MDDRKLEQKNEVEEVHKIFIHNLRLLRASENLSGQTLSQKLGYKSDKRINDLEEGRVLPKFEDLVLIVDYFPITFDDLLDGRINLSIRSRTLNQTTDKH